MKRHTKRCEMYRRVYAERYGLRRPTARVCCCPKD